eukprot:6183951-Pleurochrysis_carterae.AAC.2
MPFRRKLVSLFRIRVARRTGSIRASHRVAASSHASSAASPRSSPATCIRRPKAASTSERPCASRARTARSFSAPLLTFSADSMPRFAMAAASLVSLSAHLPLV